MAAVLDTYSWRSETLTRALVAREDCDILAELIVIRDQVFSTIVYMAQY